jgi:hypothetical protein
LSWLTVLGCTVHHGGKLLQEGCETESRSNYISIWEGERERERKRGGAGSPLLSLLPLPYFKISQNLIHFQFEVTSCSHFSSFACGHNADSLLDSSGVRTGIPSYFSLCSKQIQAEKQPEGGATYWGSQFEGRRVLRQVLAAELSGSCFKTANWEAKRKPETGQAVRLNPHPATRPVLCLGPIS